MGYWSHLDTKTLCALHPFTSPIFLDLSNRSRTTCLLSQESHKDEIMLWMGRFFEKWKAPGFISACKKLLVSNSLHVCLYVCVCVWKLLEGREGSWDVLCTHSTVYNWIPLSAQSPFRAHSRQAQVTTPTPPYMWAAFLPRQRFSFLVWGPELPQEEGAV